MGKKHLSLDLYLERFPEEYRNTISILENFRGNRTKISFTYGCNCSKTGPIKEFLTRGIFDYCAKCANKNAQTYICKYCGSEFTNFKYFERCNRLCEDKYKDLILGKDYVICNICGKHMKSLGKHLSQDHKIDIEEYKMNNQIICSDSSSKYITGIQSHESWIAIAKRNGEDLSEYFKKMGESISKSILSSDKERKRRAEVMASVNRSDVMRKKSSDTAKKTSARKDVQENRSKQLKKWREENPEDFHEKCIKKMLNSFQSKPEKKLFEFVKSIDGFNFKRNQFEKSELFSTKSKLKQIDIVDKNQRIYIEYDGQLHFESRFNNENFQLTVEKDSQLNQYIQDNNWILIRVSFDQYIDKNKIEKSYFKKECLDKIIEILNNKQPGIYKIGAAYGQY